jgi:hypothetical protein
MIAVKLSLIIQGLADPPHLPRKLSPFRRAATGEACWNRSNTYNDVSCLSLRRIESVGGSSDEGRIRTGNWRAAEPKWTVHEIDLLLFDDFLQGSNDALQGLSSHLRMVEPPVQSFGQFRYRNRFIIPTIFGDHG